MNSENERRRLIAALMQGPQGYVATPYSEMETDDMRSLLDYRGTRYPGMPSRSPQATAGTTGGTTVPTSALDSVNRSRSRAMRPPAMMRPTGLFGMR